jgi:hypothetical protein
MSSSEPSTPPAQRSEVRELRLGVVLYGGASLAIHMHGTTKELQRLVKASALVERGAKGTTPTDRPTPSCSTSSPSPTRLTFAHTRRRRRRRRDLGRRNQRVYVSKSIAHNRSQDSATSGSSAATSRCCCAARSGRRCASRCRSCS